MNGKTTAIVGVLGAGALASANSLAHGHMPPLKIGLGVIVGGAMLALLADFSPDLAGAFGLLVLTGAFVTQGPDLYARARKAIA